MYNSGSLIIFHTYFSGKNVAPPLKLTELLRLCRPYYITGSCNSMGDFVCSTGTQRRERMGKRTISGMLSSSADDML